MGGGGGGGGEEDARDAFTGVWGSPVRHLKTRDGSLAVSVDVVVDVVVDVFDTV